MTQSRQRDVAALGDTTLVQSARHGYTGAWYVADPKQCAGLAAFKVFGKEDASDAYTFELVAMGHSHTDDGTVASPQSLPANQLQTGSTLHL